ncbi:hypothetical protein AU210_000863 [Fusarium oxysporum f. sp. radicis-cucumerinum]|uniref:Uncharacterized protein n=4 Tax=Fusarium oxysporum TaxID=5507 RepID=A0A2H3I6S5_FUSOX|nr:hypothetical protein AU210_000863 [Fusarium oxysporum f. sp. radicis-cucumerinum]
MSKDLDILWLSFTISHKAPASAQACRESRALFQAEALQLFGQNIGVYKSLWFLPSLDIFYWNRYNISPGNVPGGDIPCVQNVAVDWPSGDGTDMGEVIDDIWCMFLDCKKVLFVMRHHPLPDTDVRFTKVKENDDINIEYEKTGGNGDTSGHNFVIHGQLIASVARQKWRQWRLCLFAMKLTPLEPVLEYVQE